MPFSFRGMVHQQTRWAVFLYIDISLGSILHNLNSIGISYIHLLLTDIGCCALTLSLSHGARELLLHPFL